LIHVFTGKPDGVSPVAGLVFDNEGNLYGTTSKGGTYGRGTVFMLVPSSSGVWTEKVLHNFSGRDGGGPKAGLIFDASGNLYGTTAFGGDFNFGTVFRLVPVGGGGWTENVLHNFTGGSDGGVPLSGLVFDSAGNLYGTAYDGGVTSACVFVASSGCGTVFQLTPMSSGTWNENVLYAFLGGNDGYNPDAGLILDAGGNLYGTTTSGGSLEACDGFGCGTVFEVSPSSSGWIENILHIFTGTGDGENPLAGLTIDTSGNLYGTTEIGEGGGCCGTVFELMPGSKD
jgi:uncharacterized repeat protein (TIGR03803 family)